MSLLKNSSKLLKRWEKLYRRAFNCKGFKFILSPREAGKSWFINQRLKQCKNVLVIRKFGRIDLYVKPKYTHSRIKIKRRGC